MGAAAPILAAVLLVTGCGGHDAPDGPPVGTQLERTLERTMRLSPELARVEVGPCEGPGGAGRYRCVLRRFPKGIGAIGVTVRSDGHWTTESVALPRRERAFGSRSWLGMGLRL